MSAGESVAVQCAGASKRYGSGRAVEEVSLDVHRGEVHALVGLNGAGKSTLMRLILGMSCADSGQVRVWGCDPRTMPARYWAKVGHLIDAPLAYPELTLAQNLVLAGRTAGLSRREATTSAAGLVDDLVLGQWASAPARRLSAGNRQRLGLAAALIASPRLLVLDEPTNALDPAGVVILRGLLVRRTREEGMAVFVSSHHLDEVARVADRITIMNAGRLIGSLDPSGVDLERQFFDIVYASEVRP